MEDLKNLTVEQLEQAVSVTADTKEKIALFSQIGKKYKEIGKYPAALEYHQIARTLCEESGDGPGVISSLISIGATLFEQGNYQMAFELYQKALALSESMGNEGKTAIIYCHYGTIYQEHGNYSIALEYFHKGLAMAEKAGEVGKEIASFYNNIGVLHKDQGDFALALEYFHKVLAISLEMDDKILIAICYSNIGVVYRQMGDYDLALDYYHKALTLRKEAGNKLTYAFSYINIGIIHKMKKEYHEGLEYQFKALEICREAGHKKAEITCIMNIGTISYEMKEYAQSEKYLQKALQSSAEIGSKGLHRDALNSLYQVYRAKNDMRTALDYHERYIEVRDEMNNEESTRKIANLRIRHEMEMKEKERQLMEKVLHNVLPPAIAMRIQNGEERIIERFKDTSILFADIHGFTTWSAGRDVNEVAEILDKLFQLFDGLALDHGVEKIKTIGDGYMCATGLPEPGADHAVRIAKMALAMQLRMREIFTDIGIRLRIGIHSGEVIAGIIGKNKYSYDLWGDTVNIASRMESHGVVGKVQVSEAFKNLLQDKFTFEERGEIEIKGKGLMNTWFLVK
ncbi:MAG: hypothetical protein JWO03_1778 [Bacteroidetes bacterium]|nr:hypothetical protein [Bacteroidota bacterium]